MGNDTRTIRRGIFRRIPKCSSQRNWSNFSSIRSCQREDTHAILFFRSPNERSGLRSGETTVKRVLPCACHKTHFGRGRARVGVFRSPGNFSRSSERMYSPEISCFLFIPHLAHHSVKKKGQCRVESSNTPLMGANPLRARCLFSARSAWDKSCGNLESATKKRA